MSKKAKIIEAERMETAKALEAEGDYVQAIKTYRSILAKNPVHLHSASRLLILLRKGKDIKAEMKLLKDLISSQQAHLKTLQQNWISTHQKVAEAPCQHPWPARYRWTARSGRRHTHKMEVQAPRS
ncbi:hypothetical protein [Pedobacter jeongneungensis]|uniref:hypothetical protein n=1 Tax=Pedobacter jeongneungensis TaxID=947309 RepID=UPI00046AD598|nr:hypothetical protein [Pedobacter jeongneungensis]